MDAEITAIYCITDDILKAMSHWEDPQRQMSDAEVLTTAVVAARWFGGNLESARRMLAEQRYIPGMLSKSRLNRRWHAIEELVVLLVEVLAEVWKDLSQDLSYIIDSFPIPVCDNIRIRRSKLYQGESYRGYIASKRRYFYGLRIHLMVTAQGRPVEFFLAPAAMADVRALKLFRFDLPEGSTVHADKAYTDYLQEDLLHQAAEIDLLPCRKKNSKRAVPPFVAYLQEYARKRVETVGSLISRLLPKSIHAVTRAGFELKIALFVLAVSFSCAF
jgi:hypothetical protein